LQCLKKTVDKQSENEVHFITTTKIPTLDEQNELKNQGIILIDYLSNNAYVSIDSKYYGSKVSKTLEHQ
jgi:hypothetical protein